MPTEFPLGVCALTGARNPIHPLPQPAQDLLDRGDVVAYACTYWVRDHQCTPSPEGLQVYVPHPSALHQVLDGWTDILASGIPTLSDAILSLTHPDALFALPIKRIWRHVAPTGSIAHNHYNLTVWVFRDHAWVGYADIDEDDEPMANAMDQAFATPALTPADLDAREATLGNLLATRRFDGACIGTLLLHAPSITTAHQRLALPSLIAAQGEAYLQALYGTVDHPTEHPSKTHLPWPIVPPTPERIMDALQDPIDL